MVHTLGHALSLLPAVLTHAAVGFALAYALTDAPPWVGAAAGAAPDADLYLGPPVGPFPWVHRGIVHTPAFLACVVAAAYLLSRDRGVAAGVCVAWLSHLAVDTLTNTGIAWLYPLSPRFFALDLNAHAPVQTAVLWLAAGLLVVRARDSGATDADLLDRLRSRRSRGTRTERRGGE